MSSLLEFLTINQPEFRKPRLPSLYSDFRSQRSSNPDGYQANALAWEKGLNAAAKAGALASNALNLQFGPKLEQQLQSPEYGRPLGLGAVEEESLARGQFLSLASFLDSQRSILDHSWDLTPGQVPIKLMGWVLKQAGLISKVVKDPNRQYVLLTNLESTGDSLDHEFSQLATRTERIIPIAQFRRRLEEVVKPVTLSETDFTILLKYLSRDKRLLAHDESVVKIKGPDGQLPHIESEDRHICSLKTVISDLQSQIGSINKRIDESTVKAKDALAKKNRTSALAALRSRKLHEGMLERRSNSLAQLEDIFTKIEEAESQVEIVAAMKGSTEVLRSLNKATGGVDHVDDILDSLREEMAKVDEVGGIIGEGAQGTALVDEAEIDDELEQLEAVDKAEKSQKEQNDVEGLLKQLDGLRIPNQVKDRNETAANEPTLAS